MSEALNIYNESMSDIILIIRWTQRLIQEIEQWSYQLSYLISAETSAEKQKQSNADQNNKKAMKIDSDLGLEN